MNELASELNRQLDGTAAGRLLSGFGREIYFPKGIVAQAAEAAARAKRFDATVGMAVRSREPLMLDCVSARVSGLTRREQSAYAPTAGIAALRDLWKRHIQEKNPGLGAADFSLPVVVPGLTNGIFQAAELFVDAGDEVLIPDMCWDNYELVIGVRRQARISNYAFFDGQGGFNVAGLEAAMDAALARSAKAKLVLLFNFPNNPTGYTPSRAEAARIVAAVTARAERGADILAVCDDAYFGLFYESDSLSESLFATLARCHERVLAVKVDGSTKEDYVWGFRVGFMSFGGRGLGEVHYQALQTKATGSLRASVSSSSSLAQNLMLSAYRDPAYPGEKQLARDTLEARYRAVRRIVAAGVPPCLEPLPFNSGYFMAFRCVGNFGAERLRLALLDRGIGTIALQDRFLRVAYAAVDLEDLDALYAEIFAAARELAG